MERTSRRRKFLAIIGSVASFLSGCSALSGDEPTEGSTATPSRSPTRSPIPTPTETPIDEQAPKILESEAEPIEFGTQLKVRLQGQDNRELVYAAISYGDLILEKEPDDHRVEIKGALEGIPDAEPDFPGLVSYFLRDAAGNETHETASADQSAPSLTVQAATPQAAGGLKLVLEGNDNVGLHELRTKLNGSSGFVSDATGQKAISIQKTVSTDTYNAMRLGEMNSVEVSLEDAIGNQTRKTVQQYVRAFSPLQDTYTDIGAHYIPFAGQGIHECMANDEWVPDLGRYGGTTWPYTISTAITSAQIDRMTSVGIHRALFEYEARDRSMEYLEAFLESDCSKHIAFEPVLTPTGFKKSIDGESWKDSLVPRHLSFLSDTLEGENLATHDGQPIFKVWGADWYTSVDAAVEKIKDEWGSFEALANDLRKQYQPNGKKPFLIGDFFSSGQKDEWNPTDKEFAVQFDGVTNWTAKWVRESGVETPWKDVLPFMESNFKGYNQFASEQGIEFIPLVFPGFNDKPITRRCWGASKQIPRSPKNFKKLLNLADEYRTTDMIDIGTYNGVEGHQIEPGTFKGNDYGTKYLDIVSGFASSNG